MYVITKRSLTFLVRIFAADIRELEIVGDTSDLLGSTLAVHDQLEPAATIILAKDDFVAELGGGIMQMKYDGSTEDTDGNSIYRIAYGSAGKVLLIYFNHSQIEHDFVQVVRFVVEREQLRNSLDSTNV
jgi:hypothetical protein